MTADERPPDGPVRLRPARRVVVTRRLGAAAVVAALIAVFLAARFALPAPGALAVGLALGAAALWAGHRAVVTAQSELVATGDGLVLRLGSASTELSWAALDAVRVGGEGRAVSVEVAAGRWQRRLPRAYDPDDARRWLHAAAGFAARAGRDDLRVTDGELTADAAQ